MTIKLIAIDIDDTLLSSQHQILDSTKSQIKKALDQGVKIVLCSGRPLAGVAPYLAQLGIAGDQQYVVTFNGSVIETAAGEIIQQVGITHETYRAVDQYSKTNQLAYNVLDSNSTIYTSNLDVDPITVVQAWENEAGLLIRQPDQVKLDVKMIKAVFTGPSAVLDQHEAAVKAQFGQENYVVRAGSRFLEVMHRAVNKGAALKQLARHLQIQPTEIMAIGDEQNDIPMFNFAGTAVAMANGSAAAKQHADFITTDNDHDGIAQALDQYIF
ncbi:Cof-type HAD-IIB family hydrolase [Latilactobacillus fuchuensis]|uniref:Cof-like hydrolase family protein n=2 Tax=Latilactobacillus fuchuensis TaxID=164393 RepID=A0A2N9DV19_9LACO|nr:Cof-type HAD-IIB family hydrolase [Latilactobacillus fuchuensis]KRL61658.1 cof-like hydrolase family protein [Latilactobacillus fuchuensis DSM 14340 = JCM 11249]MCP8857881.1 Cof-type HAD-IIB family hydrolase [Latilactobacillus fuchuensis]SPC38295.1 Cof-like hydrolase family protein [Latilactobacillus fuchuensis]